ncbi:MAG: hypothetical protein EBZ34_02725, partial [Flavobacteriia bacterium]|nr:hypothetical protein [Flavobacteriia bacterium]
KPVVLAPPAGGIAVEHTVLVLERYIATEDGNGATFGPFNRDGARTKNVHALARPQLRMEVEP